MRRSIRQFYWSIQRCDLLHETVRGKSAVTSGKDSKQLVVELNPCLRGWGDYFRRRFSSGIQQYGSLCDSTPSTLAASAWRPMIQEATIPTHEQLYAMGLKLLMGTQRYTTQATPRRSSLSRVPENGTHGLKGDATETGQPR